MRVSFWFFVTETNIFCEKSGKVVTIGGKSDSDHPKVDFCDQKCPEKQKYYNFWSKNHQTLSSKMGSSSIPLGVSKQYLLQFLFAILKFK